MAGASLVEKDDGAGEADPPPAAKDDNEGGGVAGADNEGGAAAKEDNEGGGAAGDDNEGGFAATEDSEAEVMGFGDGADAGWGEVEPVPLMRMMPASKPGPWTVLVWTMESYCS